MKKDKVKKVVRNGYAKIARQSGYCCGSATCGDAADLGKKISKSIGYSDDELQSVPEGANLGLGCGNPVALASLKEGEMVLDLGSGAGLDCFLAANKVGPKGRVIGVDMTPEMIGKARENARRGKHSNVEFRLGEIENLPVADSMVDVVISNCVINLSADKKRVFEEAFRVLRPGGRLMVSDIVQLRQLPENVRKSVQAYVGCLSGAIKKEKYLNLASKAGFENVELVEEARFPVKYMANDPTAKALVAELGMNANDVEEIGDAIESIKFRAVKPLT
jgi:ubiquinone/menaquinone biosynthesis C-methylase UbiE